MTETWLACIKSIDVQKYPQHRLDSRAVVISGRCPERMTISQALIGRILKNNLLKRCFVDFSGIRESRVRSVLGAG